VKRILQKWKGLVLKNRVDGTFDRLEIDGVFGAIGHAPGRLLQGKVEVHAEEVRVRCLSTTPASSKVPRSSSRTRLLIAGPRFTGPPPHAQGNYGTLPTI
jgi:hypothetical protein